MLATALTGPDNDAAAATRQVLGVMLDRLLRLLHPFLPFVTDELWTALTGGESVVIARWPGAVAAGSQRAGRKRAGGAGRAVPGRRPGRRGRDQRADAAGHRGPTVPLRPGAARRPAGPGRAGRPRGYAAGRARGPDPRADPADRAAGEAGVRPDGVGPGRGGDRANWTRRPAWTSRPSASGPRRTWPPPGPTSRRRSASWATRRSWSGPRGRGGGQEPGPAGRRARRGPRLTERLAALPREAEDRGTIPQ